MNFKVTFHLDGTGVYYDINEPTHLDALLSWSLAPRSGVKKVTGRDEDPEYLPLPLLKRNVKGGLIWCASAILPEGGTGESIQFWRKRFRQSRADITNGSPNLKNAIYRDWNNPYPLILCTKMVAYASGNRKKCKRLLRDVKHLGKKGAHGCGKIIKIGLDECDEDYSLVKDGRSMRWLPEANGVREVRLTPPYWNNTNKVTCCEVGDEYEL